MVDIRVVGQPIYDRLLANRWVAHLQRDPVKASCSIGDGDIPLNCVLGQEGEEEEEEEEEEKDVFMVVVV